MDTLLADMTKDMTRIALTAGAAAAFLLISVLSFWGTRKKASGDNGFDHLVLYASQTGQAEDLAKMSYQRLISGGIKARLMGLSSVKSEHLQQAKLILCVASTTGEGNAPDEAHSFERTLMATVLDLSQARFAVLALGDRNYDHFCAYGHRVFDWLKACGASEIMPCLEVDDLDPKALEQWQQTLSRLGAVNSGEDQPLYHPWVLHSRQRLNPMSDGPGLYHLKLAPETGEMDWQAGDLAEIITPGGHMRDYSIASLPPEGSVELYVRQVIKDGGQKGEGSGLLTHDLPIGAKVSLRLKSHKGFHSPEGPGPILMIAAGSGLAGLRAHILSEKTRPLWMIYGERHPQNDADLCDQLGQFKTEDRLFRLDFAFSRPETGEGQYVQDLLTSEANAVRDFLKTEGAIMVCGRLDMGRAVDAALRDILGDAALEQALAAGRYRRDLY